MTSTSTHPDLSAVKCSLSYVLNSNLELFNSQLEDTAVTLAQLKLNVHNAVMALNDKDYEHKSPATKRFLLALNKQTNKVSVVTLIYNTILAGDNLAVI